MMFARICRREAVLKMATAVRLIKNSYLYGWEDATFNEAVRCLAEATERLAGKDAMYDVFGPVRKKPRKGLVMKTDFGEIFKLKDLLDHEGIPNDYVNLDNEEAGIFGRQIIYPSADEGEWVSDVALCFRAVKDEEDEEAVFNAMSLGAPLLEQMGLVGEGKYGTVGSKTAEQVFECWKKHFEEANNGKGESANN